MIFFLTTMFLRNFQVAKIAIHNSVVLHAVTTPSVYTNLGLGCQGVVPQRHLTEGVQEARRCPNENLGMRAHKNEGGLKLLCSDWRELSKRFSWDIAEAI